MENIVVVMRNMENLVVDIVHILMNVTVERRNRYGMVMCRI